MRRWTTALVVGGICAWLVGCEDQPPQVDAGTEQLPIAEIEPPPDYSDTGPVQPAHPGPVEFSSWPGGREDETFELMWLGGDETVQLYAEPEDDAEVVASASWRDAQQLEWLATRVHVDEPRALTVVRPVELRGTPYRSQQRRLAPEQRQYVLEEGDELFFYEYDGEETCYYGIDDEIVLSDCLSESVADADEDGPETGERLTPLSKQWWVQVEATDGARGWMLVDRAPVEVHRRTLEGYDGVDGPEQLDEDYVD